MFNRGVTYIAFVSIICQISTYELQGSHDVKIKDETLDWWQSAVFYQIYPRSFQDSNADGYGDLQGIISRLDHLREAGITATWLSPIFVSPGVDQGYDIADYYAIDEMFGTMEDFEELVAKANEKGIRVMMDFVPNHTSDQHRWFQLSQNRTEGYEDYYIWVDGEPDVLPNNWLSAFQGPTWTYHEGRQQWYYHQFARQQPDLNYANPKVVESMKNVLKFWMEKGVSGFRLDAVVYLFEDSTLRDAPYARGYTSCDGNPVCQDQTNIVKDLDGTYDIVYQFRQFVDDYVAATPNKETVVLMSESYTTIENTMLYYQNLDGSRKGVHFSFNFNFITYLTSSTFNVDNVINTINKWFIYLPQGCTSNWELGNHDNRRVASRFGEDNVDGLNMMIAILPGVMITYNGEEIGMLDGEVTCEEGQDPSAIKDCSTYNETTRDFERTPFQWDDSLYAGFSTVKPWLPVSPTKDWLNLDAQKEVKSHFSVYKDLTEFRKVFKQGSQADNVSVIKLSEHSLQIVRFRDEGEYIWLFNIGESDDNVNFYRLGDCYQVAITSVNSDKNKGDQFQDNLLLHPHESVILQSCFN